MIFETHLHLCDEKFDIDRDEILARAKHAGVDRILNVGAELKEIRKIAALDLPGVYKAMGIHPENAGECTADVYAEIESYLKNSANALAVGEIGLDYHRDTTHKQLQEEVFRKFLDIAHGLDLPVVIHSRDAHDDVIKILEEYNLGKKGIIHCFSGDAGIASRFISMGYVLGIGGVITFPNARVLRDAVAHTPLESIVLETDAPWLAPQQHRGERNESSYLKFVAAEIAKLKGISAQDVENVTYRTAEKVLGL
jgi:TatD DNase family protein